MKPLDKVAEAYYGGMGDQFSRKTRERIHWICSKVTGGTVLDIGCSQGIAELILAREGKKAVGIDIEDSVIAYANEALQNQSDSVKRNVEYFVSSVFDYENNEKFDTVILTEVMEHFTSSSSLLQKVKSFLVEDGTIVITVPFGINDYFDHKKTYYMLNLVEELEPYFEVKEIKFFGKWIGVVGRNTADPASGSVEITRDLTSRLEEAFFAIERSTVDDLNAKIKLIDQLNTRVNENREKLASVQRENEKLKSIITQLENENNKFMQVGKESINQNELDETVKHLSSSLSACKERVEELEEVVEEKNKELLRRLDSEEQTLKKYKESIFDYNQLEAKYANVSKKYNLLSNAKLGRLTLKYWKLRNRIPEDF
ncbi:class I SAM-dependent methyltransferase [Paenibacillus aquistagni]|uniref:class I SAM-dependent methyltransferase n=1 Tax=Paenibacillus aquistagni TaxID=1852522 RepID=UPI00145A3E82|nr:methyltransferase domain-containing protein [Paenibacillus aquistagni]NMM54267.1 class I SAM-dependent methyltransferase [Paenibacillus aquistagni]